MLIEGPFAPVSLGRGGEPLPGAFGHPRSDTGFGSGAVLPVDPESSAVRERRNSPSRRVRGRSRDLAREIAGGTGTDDERAKRLVRFFASGFLYTLSDPASSIREFLFRKRAGYCEHFAGGLSLATARRGDSFPPSRRLSRR